MQERHGWYCALLWKYHVKRAGYRSPAMLASFFFFFNMRDLLNYLLLNKLVVPFLGKLKEQLQLLLPGSRGYSHIGQHELP